MTTSSRWRALIVTMAFTPFIGGGLHCGMANTIGPSVHQEIAAAPASVVRVRRAAADYVSAELVLTYAPRTTVRACDDDGRFIAMVEGTARVPIRGTCVELALSALETPREVTIEIVTDIGKQVVLQENCSPHGSPSCINERRVEPGTTVGEGREKWTLWSVERIDVTAP